MRVDTLIDGTFAKVNDGFFALGLLPKEDARAASGRGSVVGRGATLAGTRAQRRRFPFPFPIIAIGTREGNGGRAGAIGIHRFRSPYQIAF
jgi:hypothetical protein